MLALPASLLALWQLRSQLGVRLPVIAADEFHESRSGHQLSILLTNPGEHYVVLQRFWLEVTAFESKEFYALPEPGIVSMSLPPYERLQRYEATDGPVERHRDEVRLAGTIREYPLFAETKIVFPKGETREFVVDIRAGEPGVYTYRLVQEWSVPEKGTLRRTYTTEHDIDRLLVHDTAATCKLLEGLERELLVVCTDLGTLENSLSLEAVQRVPIGVPVTALIPRTPIPEMGTRVVFLLDGVRALQEVDSEDSASRMAELVDDPGRIREIKTRLGLEDVSLNFDAYAIEVQG